MDQNLKHRLTGAIILVSLAVIFIPVILEGPDNEWAPPSHGIPESPQLDYKARMQLPRSVDIPAPVVRVQEDAVMLADKPAELVTEKIVIATPAPRSAAPGNPPVDGDWYVQVGSFSQELNASKLSERLNQAGYNAAFDKTGASAGALYRVLVGPDTSRQKAENLRDRLAMEFKLKGIVVNNPG